MNEINEQNRIRGTETWDRLTAVEGGGDWLKEGEGIRQRADMQDPWT